MTLTRYKIRWQIVAKVLALILLILSTELLPRMDEVYTLSMAEFRPVLRFFAILLALNVGLSIFKVGYRRRKHMMRGQDDSTLLGLTNVYYIVNAFFILGGIISLYGIDFQTLFTTLSIIAAAIAIITRDFIVEIIAGLVMSFSGQVAVGDYIGVGDTKGKVTTLTLTKTVLLSEDDDLIHVPNSTIFGGELVNYTKRMQRRVSIEFEVALTAIDSVDDFERDLISAVSEFEDEVIPGSYSLRVVELHKDYAEFKFRYTLQQRSSEVERDIRRRTARRVINYIHTAGRNSSMSLQKHHSDA